jgi:hypothetical protein
VLPDLAAGGYETWYPELRFSTKPSDEVKTIEIEPSGFSLEPIDYGYGVTRTCDFKIKALNMLKLNHLKIGGVCLTGHSGS